MDWVKYKEQKPEIGQLVLVFRDTESKEYMYPVKWNQEEERYADWNNITHWLPIELPITD
jgi:hypothetical protein